MLLSIIQLLSLCDMAKNLRLLTTGNTIDRKVAVFAETLWTEIAIFSKCLVS